MDYIQKYNEALERARAYFENENYTEMADIPLAEWSKEDKERIQRIHDFMWKNRKGDTDTIYQIEKDADWLESLPERFVLQSKQEWSEEDERKLQRCIAIVEGWEVDYDIAYAPYSSMLKSLRPDTYKNCNSRWSEEDKKLL